MGSHASLRAVGSMLHRITNGASSKCSTYSFALLKHGFVNGNLLSSISSSTSWVSLYEVKYESFQVRTLQTFPLVCMGRRSCKIAGRKVYGYGGVSMVVEVLTDKISRSVAAVREVVKDYGGKMADPGSVSFKFRRARVVNIKVTYVNKDQLFDKALDAGAEDVIEPPV
ncbi:hypothetical protein EZV62_004717 [Acer yangbiense]|uniref:TACO1/YebC-like second and third domain-containing protein n=1 Tax=Acer yangbiense TaxID=1000413 RepID=A0A5C7IMF7_9ROSI|nr:hypothetical protein EZV62_004717 [Acer yangbiense]